MSLKAFRFSLETDKLILTPSDVLQTLDIGVDNDDHLSDVRFSTPKLKSAVLITVDQLSTNVKGTMMAFCTDSGSVGVVDTQTNEITRMKQSHTNVSIPSPEVGPSVLFLGVWFSPIYSRSSK